MDTVSDLVVKKFLERNIIDAKMQDMYREGVKLILADIINISIIILIGILLHRFTCSAVFLLVFWTVRWFAGGFHAKTYGMCRITTVSSFAVSLILGIAAGTYARYLTIIFDTAAFLTILIFAPIKHPNKELSTAVRKRSKKIALVMTAIFSAVSVILCRYARIEGFIISSTLFIITVLMYAGMMTNGTKEGKHNE